MAKICRNARRAILAVILFPIAACDLFDVTNPTTIEEDDVANPDGAELARRNAVAYLYAFVSEAARTSALRSDEVFFFPSLTTVQTGAVTTDMLLDLRINDLNRGANTNLTYQWANNVRKAASFAISLYLKYGADWQRADLGQVLAIKGMGTAGLADYICLGFALHDYADGGPVYAKPASSTVEVYERALEDLDSAVVYAAQNERVLSLARVARGRILLALGRFEEAARAVAEVPTTFTYLTEFTGAGAFRNGFLFSFSSTGNNLSVSDREGGNGLDFVSAGDPRVQVRRLGTAWDGVTDLYAPLKYQSLRDPIVIASGIEARLIEAEAQLNGATPGDWLATLNALRATQIDPPLPPLTDPGTPDARLDLLFRERAFWLFLTGRRLPDLRRLVDVYKRDPERVFPTGTNPGGLTYERGMGIAFSPTGEQYAGTGVTGCVD